MTALTKLTLSEARRELQARNIGARELTEACLAQIEKTEPEIRACLSVLAEPALARAGALDRQGPDPGRLLWGLPLSLKDIYCTKGLTTTCASKMLENYQPPYESRVSGLLLEAGAIFVAKTNLDEFAMGSTTEFSAFGPSRNPWDVTKVPGGSSGGAAASVAAYQTPGAMGSDTGGSIRQPAALCGCVGLKPTYGRVSRYGMVAFGSSLDQAGPLARRVADCALLLQAIAGPDPRDATSSNRPADNYLGGPRAGGLVGLRLGLPEECWSAGLSPEVEQSLKAALAKLSAAGAELVPVRIPHLRYAVATYYILASAEASTNLARFDGVRYGRRSAGHRDLLDLYTASRSEALGEEVKRRILIGTFTLSSGYYDAYYKKAARVRRLIKEDYEKALAECDLLLSPVSPVTAWEFGRFAGDPLAAYQMDILTLPVNLAGLPALSMPAGLGAASGLPVGLQLIGRALGEAELLAAGEAVEEVLPPLLK